MTVSKELPGDQGLMKELTEWESGAELAKHLAMSRMVIPPASNPTAAMIAIAATVIQTR